MDIGANDNVLIKIFAQNLSGAPFINVNYL